MSCSSRQRVKIRGCTLSFEPMEQRRMLAGDGLDESRATSFSSREGGTVSFDHFSPAGAYGAWTTTNLTAHSYGAHAAGLGSGLDLSPATLMDQRRPPEAATSSLASRLLSGFGNLPRNAIEVADSTGDHGVLVRDLGTGLTVHMGVPRGSTIGGVLGPGGVGAGVKKLPPPDSNHAYSSEGGPVSVSQALRPQPVDLAATTGRAARGDRTVLSSGRSALSMVMGEMARGVVAAGGARPAVASVAGGGSARLPAGSSPVGTAELRGRVAASADGVIAGRRAVAVTPAVFAGLQATDEGTSAEPTAVLSQKGGPTSSDEHAAVKERIDGAGPRCSRIAAATVPRDDDDLTWRRLLAVAPVVILVVVQKLVDDALTHEALRPDGETVGPADLRRPGCMPRLAERRPARRRTPRQTA